MRPLLILLHGVLLTRPLRSNFLLILSVRNYTFSKQSLFAFKYYEHRDFFLVPPTMKLREISVKTNIRFLY